MTIDLTKFYSEIRSGLRYPMSDRLRGGKLKAGAQRPATSPTQSSRPASSPRPVAARGGSTPTKAKPAARAVNRAAAVPSSRPSKPADKARLATLAATVDKLSARLAAAVENELKPRLGKLEERVDRLENGHTMGPRTGGAEHRLYKLEKRVDSLEGLDPTEPEKVKGDDELSERVDALETRVEALEKRAANKKAMDARMGLYKPKGEIRREGRSVVFGVMTPEDARKALAAGQRGRK